jgi:hypothetical protein
MAATSAGPPTSAHFGQPGSEWVSCPMAAHHCSSHQAHRVPGCDVGVPVPKTTPTQSSAALTPSSKVWRGSVWGDRRSSGKTLHSSKRMMVVGTNVLRRPPGSDRGLRSATYLLDVNAELGTATARVDPGKVTDATVPVVAAARLAVNALMGQVFADRLLGLDISPTKSYPDVAIPSRSPLMVHVSLATEPRRLLKALRSNCVGTFAVDAAHLHPKRSNHAEGKRATEATSRQLGESPQEWWGFG